MSHRAFWRQLLGGIVLAILILGGAATRFAYGSAWLPSVPMNAGRWYHTSTLLQDGRVLVTGGETGGYGRHIVNSTEIFDPSLNHWTSVASMRTARANHTANLLSDGRVLVAGGYNYDLNDCCTKSSTEIYSPAIDQWSPSAPMSTSRKYHTSVTLLDGRVLVVGGQGQENNFALLASAEVYNPVSNNWSSAGSMAQVRIGHTTTLLPDGRVLVTGGTLGYVVGGFSSAEIYNPTTNTWSAAASMQQSRAYHTATLLTDGRVMVVGAGAAEIYNPATNIWSSIYGSLASSVGYHTASLLADGRLLNTGIFGAEIYDSSLGLWVRAGTPSTVRAEHRATSLADGRVLITGGVKAAPWDTYDSNALASSEIFDPVASRHWAPASDAIIGGSDPTIDILPNGKILRTGGVVVTTTSSPASKDVGIYDISTNRWTVAAPMATARHKHASSLLADGRVLVTGGLQILNTTGTTTAEIYDPSTNSWAPAAPMGLARVGHVSARLPDGRVLVVGGTLNDLYSVTATTEIYDPSTNTWTSAAPTTSARAAHKAVTLLDGRVLIVGPDSNVPITAEIYDPEQNSWSSASSPSVIRRGFAMTLSVDGKVLAVGGVEYRMGDDGVERNISIPRAEIYDPSTNSWTIANPMSVGRDAHSATLLADGRILVTGGNYTNGNALPKLWASSEIYDPLTDTWTPSATMNSMRASHKSFRLGDDRVLVIGGVGPAIINFQYGNAPYTNGEIFSTKIIPEVGWKLPQSITYGTLLSSQQLNATASVPGNFVYTPSAGSLVDAGLGQTLAAVFLPTDRTNYSPAPAHVSFNVYQSTPTLSLTGGTFVYDGNTHPATTFAYGIGGVNDVLSPPPMLHYGDSIESLPVPREVGIYPVKAKFLGNQNYQPAELGGGVVIIHGVEFNPPDTFITSGPPGPSNANSVTFQYGGIDDVSQGFGLRYSTRLDRVGSASSTFSGFDAFTRQTYFSLSPGTYTFYVKTRDEALNEDPTPASFTFTILPPPAVSINDVSLNEGDSSITNFQFTIALSTATDQSVTVSYSTANGTAKAGTDYYSSTGTVTFNPGETTKRVDVFVNGDIIREPDETFSVNITSAYNATIGRGQGVGTIINDDSPCVLRINDFDGDCKSDVGIYRAGAWSIKGSIDNGISISGLGNATWSPVPADYDGDGLTDEAVYHNGAWMILRSSDGQKIVTGFGGPTFIPVPSDYDGDGKADIAVYLDGMWSIRRTSDGTNQVIAHGGSGWIPVASDYDGDGRVDVAVYLNGAWSIKRTSDNVIVVVGHGGVGWEPVPGDYDGDGKSDIAVYMNGAWSILRSSDNVIAVIGHGGPDWFPVPADYDGDGKTDVAVYHPIGAWSIKRSSDGAIQVVGHGGGPTDVPLN